MIETILVPLDGSALAERALPYAVRLASAAGARLLLMHGRARAPVASGGHEFDIAAFAQQLREALAVGMPTAEGRVDIDALVRDVPTDRVADAICAVAQDRRADLIVMSTHGRSGLGRWLYGSVAEATLRQATVPVMLIPAASEGRWAEDRPLRILVPLDGSDRSEEALGPAGALADAVHGDLLMLRVVEPAPEGRPVFDVARISLAYAQQAPEAELEAARQYLEGLTSRPGMFGRSVDVLVDAGDPTAVIARVAREERIDVIAMATHGRSGLARLGMGSVATGTLHRAGVPVLLVGPAAVRASLPAAGSPPTAASARPATRARKQVPVVDLRPNTAISSPVGLVADVENGMEVALGQATRVLLFVANEGASPGVVTVRAGNPRHAPRAGEGDLTVLIPPGEHHTIGPLEATRFRQDGGVLWLDFSPNLAATITAFRLPAG